MTIVWQAELMPFESSDYFSAVNIDYSFVTDKAYVIVVYGDTLKQAILSVEDDLGQLELFIAYDPLSLFGGSGLTQDLMVLISKTYYLAWVREEGQDVRSFINVANHDDDLQKGNCLSHTVYTSGDSEWGFYTVLLSANYVSEVTLTHTSTDVTFTDIVANSVSIEIADWDVINVDDEDYFCQRTVRQEENYFEYELGSVSTSFDPQFEYYEGFTECDYADLTITVVDSGSSTVDGSTSPISWTGTEFSVYTALPAMILEHELTVTISAPLDASLPNSEEFEVEKVVSIQIYLGSEEELEEEELEEEL